MYSPSIRELRPASDTIIPVSSTLYVLLMRYTLPILFTYNNTLSPSAFSVTVYPDNILTAPYSLGSIIFARSKVTGFGVSNGISAFFLLYPLISMSFLMRE